MGFEKAKACLRKGEIVDVLTRKDGWKKAITVEEEKDEPKHQRVCPEGTRKNAHKIVSHNKKSFGGFWGKLQGWKREGKQCGNIGKRDYKVLEKRGRGWPPYQGSLGSEEKMLVGMNKKWGHRGVLENLVGKNNKTGQQKMLGNQNKK